MLVFGEEAFDGSASAGVIDEVCGQWCGVHTTAYQCYADRCGV